MNHNVNVDPRVLSQRIRGRNIANVVGMMTAQKINGKVVVSYSFVNTNTPDPNNPHNEEYQKGGVPDKFNRNTGRNIAVNRGLEFATSGKTFEIPKFRAKYVMPQLKTFAIRAERYFQSPVVLVDGTHPIYFDPSTEVVQNGTEVHADEETCGA